MGRLNLDTNRVYLIIKARLKCDVLEAEKWMKEGSATFVFNLKEEKTKYFEWYLSDDNTEATLIESYDDSDGAKKRVENHMASPAAEEFMDRFEPLAWNYFGNVKQDLIDLTTPLGAKFQRYVGGFNHT